jgi:ABC-type lipoprotein export system ATPase subunit
LAGEEVSDLSRNARAGIRSRQIGFVFQNFNLLARTPAVDNVELPLLYSGHRAGNRRQRAVEVLEQVGMGDRLDHHSSQLSGGQQQRVAIARSLVNDPAILLADEPTGNLDSRTSRDVMQIFRELNEDRGITIVLVTHEQEVARHARRWIVLRDGLIVADTTDFEHAMRSLHPADPDATVPPDV